MKFRFPLTDVNVSLTDSKREIQNPLFDNGFFCVNQSEMAICVEEVATYYMFNGDNIQVRPEKNADFFIVEHFLNSWGVVGILHQRKMINFHASAFNFEGRGVMICGDSGAGKSSLTAEFSLKGAEFISDDITCVVFKENQPVIWPIPNSIALRKESVEQLGLEKIQALRVNPMSRKNEYHFSNYNNTQEPFYEVFWIHISEGNEIVCTELKDIDKFTMLRGEICGWDILKGMPETEAVYLRQLINLSRNVRITKVERPKKLPVSSLGNAIRSYLKVEEQVSA